VNSQTLLPRLTGDFMKRRNSTAGPIDCFRDRSGLAHAIIKMLANREGGLAGLIQIFNNKGVSRPYANLPISADQIQLARTTECSNWPQSRGFPPMLPARNSRNFCRALPTNSRPSARFKRAA